METRDLIKAMAADAAPVGPGFTARWVLAVGLAMAVAVAVFAALLRPRADLAEVLFTPRFGFKLAVVVLLALTAVPVLRSVARPSGRVGVALAVVPVVLLAGVAVEWLALPEGTRWAAMIGQHNRACLGLVTLIGLGPLAVFLGFLRQGAPTDLRRAGALAGLAAGGISASLYALHCTDDSVLFVAVWYLGAILGLAALGAILAPRFARW